MNREQDLIGALRITPGVAVPNNLNSSRRDWAMRMGQGQDAAHLPGLMASLFNLCGQSHRLCSRMAVAAAQGVQDTHGAAAALQLETASEHVRRICLDWPRAAGTSEQAATLAAQATLSLKHSPLLKAPEATPSFWAAMRTWLEVSCLHMPAGDWLAAWCAAPEAWLQSWSRQHKGWLPSLLLQARRSLAAHVCLRQDLALRPHAQVDDLCAWAQTWQDHAHFVLQPQWQGRFAHTGTWSRLNQDASHALTPWLLMGYRVAELIRLCLPDARARSGQHWLSLGAANVGAGQGVAWVEMARGLLMHQVSLDAEQRVTQLHVVAPTEWNFHPQGAVASVLAQMPPDAEASTLGWLMAAFDPCVPFEVHVSRQEAPHA
jgi:hypothetical protein